MKSEPPAIAYRIHTPRLVLRCWDPADAPRLVEAITQNLEHLRRWMPWALKEPESIAAKADRLRKFRIAFDRRKDFLYGIFDRDENAVLGSIGSHDRIGTGAREIGYWIGAEYANRGLITEAAAALTRAAVEIEKLQRLEIHCDPDNFASAAIPRKLGFTLAVTIPNCVRDPALDPRDTAIYALRRAEYAAAPAAAVPFEAFDALGNRVA